MNVHLVVFALHEERPDFDADWAAFIAHLDRYESVGDPEVESIRFVSTELTAGQVSADLSTKLDSHDKIVVAQVMEGTYCGRLSRDVWAWTEALVRGKPEPEG
ncbi:MAG: hypothetical protein ABWX67_16170 [Allosphingosinicella sp.]